MSQQKPPLIFKISSSFGSAIFDYGIYSNWQMNVYLTSTVKLNLVKFHNGISMLTLNSSPTCSAIESLVDTYLKDIFADKMCIHNALTCD